MAIEYIKGDLFDTDCKYIAHGVNCQGVMGSGVAKIVKERYPESFEIYKLFATTPRMIREARYCVFSHPELDGKSIIHLFTQDKYGKDGSRYVNYEWMYLAFEELSRAPAITKYSDKQVAMPKIGAGLGGGDWDIIELMIKKTLCAQGVKVKVYEL